MIYQAKSFSFYYFLSLIGILFFFSCNENVEFREKTTSEKISPWLNHGDSAKYVGKQTCRLCHQSIYTSFIETGMGHSIGRATKINSSADFKHSVIYDQFNDLYYQTKWKNDSLFIVEFRLRGKDTIFKRMEKIEYIIGSGQHTNSHLIQTNGYINQAPMTFFTQKKKWDLPPGFEQGKNSRFNRLIGLECMSCHNAFPDFVSGSENKFNSIPEGIDCERCHGPGSIHVRQKSNRELVDTAKEIDYSIVNPAKLPIERQFDICMRCHLQGNAVLAENKSWFDFKPGMNLSDFISVFLPRYKNGENEFIMASHADRLKQSKCFTVSLVNVNEKNKSLRPYKNALTCVTCHNPHVSVKQTSGNHFNTVCTSCHTGKKLKSCSENEEVLKKKQFNCISCHMPQSGSNDIPHVSIHDHYIRKKISSEKVEKIKVFLRLQSINNSRPDSITIAKAYINQFEKFDPQPNFLDSALKFLNHTKSKNAFNTEIQIYFNQRNYITIKNTITTTGIDSIINKILITPSLSNEDAWCCYRIGETFVHLNDYINALRFFEQASKLAPFQLEFKNKLGTALIQTNQNAAARKIFNALIIEYPKDSKPWTNLGYLDALEGNTLEAEKNYLRALAINPDHVPALLNLGGLKIMNAQFEDGGKLIVQAIKKEPENERSKFMLSELIAKLAVNGKKEIAKHLVASYLKTDNTSSYAASLKEKIR